jgi:pyruvyl transferase EpsO
VSRALVAAHRARLLEELDAAIPADAGVALVDVPLHTNVGDQAIFLGELAALRALGRRVTHVPGPLAADPAALRRAVGNRTVALHGGGNLGDLWPAHQLLRERVLAELPGHRVVQLPQSIHFEDGLARARAREVMAGHADFTLLVRDAASVAAARDGLGLGARLIPDAAFGLGPLAPRGAPARDVLLLARTDHEAAPGRTLPPGLVPEDWLVAAPDRRADLARRAGRALDDLDGRRPRLAGAQCRASLAAWEGFATAHLERGLRLLSSARVVLTDRLHAHLLALLLGIPSVVCDNASGKIRGLHDAWTADSPLVTWAPSLAAGAPVAAAIAAAGASRPRPRGGRARFGRGRAPATAGPGPAAPG